MNPSNSGVTWSGAGAEAREALAVPRLTTAGDTRSVGPTAAQQVPFGERGLSMARGLRWFLFVVGVGCLIACGVYIGRSSGWGLLRALMFLLLGLFFVLMYGENDSRERGGQTPPEPD